MNCDSVGDGCKSENARIQAYRTHLQVKSFSVDNPCQLLCLLHILGKMQHDLYRTDILKEFLKSGTKLSAVEYTQVIKRFEPSFAESAVRLLCTTLAHDSVNPTQFIQLLHLFSGHLPRLIRVVHQLHISKVLALNTTEWSSVHTIECESLFRPNLRSLEQLSDMLRDSSTWLVTYRTNRAVLGPFAEELSNRQMVSVAAFDPGNDSSMSNNTTKIEAPMEKCSICWAIFPNRYAVIPCGHACLCGDCHLRIVQCPLCRGPVEETIRIFQS